MAKKRSGHGRATPKGTRPPYLQPVGGRDDGQGGRSPVDGMVDSAGKELLALEDPIEAEAWASQMLGLFDTMGLKARLGGMEVPPFLEALVERCAERVDRRSAVVAAALAAVAPPPEGERAAQVAARLAQVARPLPGWVTTVGKVTPTRAWTVTDPFGDQDSLMVAFRQEGAEAEHVLLVLVDHNLSGQAKDAWIAGDVEAVLASWRESAEAGTRLDEASVDAVLERLRDAMAMSDLWDGDGELRTEEFAQHRALVWARLRRAGLDEAVPDGPEVSDEERAALVGDFLASKEGRHLLEGVGGRRGGRVDVELLAHQLVDLRVVEEGRPLRWSPTVVAHLLGDLAPRKLLVGPDEAAALPEVLRAFVRFAADRTGLERTYLEETLAAIDELEPEYLAAMGDPEAAGPAKALLSALQAQGVDLADPEALGAALGEGPLHLPGGLPGGVPATGRPGGKATTRRRAATAPAEVVASAAGAPALARFAQLTAFYGAGRKLTQTGQPTLADARHLVDALGTEDRLDEAIGDRTFRTRSAAELPELGFTIRWAVAAGALRKEHGKLKATAAWQKLEAKPLERWARAADALPPLGPLASYFEHARYRSSDEVLDELAPVVLGHLAEGPAPFDDVLDLVCTLADATYEWLAPYLQDPDHRRTSFGWDLDLLTRILGWAGIVERTGARSEPEQHGPPRLVGGSLALTPAGRWWLERS